MRRARMRRARWGGGWIVFLIVIIILIILVAAFRWRWLIWRF
jgi:hypothetical protein